MSLCEADGCFNKHSAKGFCNKHYLRMYTNGTLEPKVRPSAIERILAKTIRASTGCLLYTGKLTKKGYAHVRADNKKMRFAHVIMYEHAYGPVSTGKELDHTCRERACVEETHLEAVTHRENCRRGITGWNWIIFTRNARGQFQKVKAEAKGLL